MFLSAQTVSESFCSCRSFRGTIGFPESFSGVMLFFLVRFFAKNSSGPRPRLIFRLNLVFLVTWFIGILNLWNTKAYHFGHCELLDDLGCFCFGKKIRLLLLCILTVRFWTCRFSLVSPQFYDKLCSVHYPLPVRKWAISSNTICHPKPSAINKLCNRYQGRHKYEAGNLSASNTRAFIQFSRQGYID